MTPSDHAALSRRDFMQLALSASGGLLLSVHFAADEAAANAGAHAIGMLVRIEPDGSIVIGARGPEIGRA